MKDDIHAAVEEESVPVPENETRSQILKEGGKKLGKTVFTGAFSTVAAMATHYNSSNSITKTYQFGVQVISTLVISSLVQDIMLPLIMKNNRSTTRRLFLWGVLQVTLITVLANAAMYAERTALPPILNQKENLQTSAIFAAYLALSLVLKLIVEQKSNANTNPHLMAGVDLLVTVSGAVLAGLVQYFSSPLPDNIQSDVRAAVSFGHASLFQAAGEHLLQAIKFKFPFFCRHTSTEASASRSEDKETKTLLNENSSSYSQ